MLLQHKERKKCASPKDSHEEQPFKMEATWVIYRLNLSWQWASRENSKFGSKCIQTTSKCLRVNRLTTRTTSALTNKWTVPPVIYLQGQKLPISETCQCTRLATSASKLDSDTYRETKPHNKKILSAYSSKRRPLKVTHPRSASSWNGSKKLSKSTNHLWIRLSNSKLLMTL